MCEIPVPAAEGKDLLTETVNRYTSGIQQEFDARWEVWPISVTNPAPTEVIIGLLHRQCRLAHNMAWSPSIWNPELAPIILRCMVEVHIWLAWILEDPDDRAKKFILDGLGKEKLIIKHRNIL